ncbi:MAG TPA: glycosyltransferase family 2 protein [Telluria sp.]
MAGISIIIPYFNRENTIERCLRSIGLGEGHDIEVIIVDDCSAQPLAGFTDPAIRVFRLDSNMGPVAARALGASKAGKEFLMFFDSDDELVTGWHTRMQRELECNPGFDIYGFPDEKYVAGERFVVANLDDYWRWVQRDGRASDYLITMRASAYRAVPMPPVRISEIWYIVQLFEHGLKAAYSATPLFRYHQDSGNQLSKKRFLRLDTAAYTRKSLAYAVKVFGRNRAKMKQAALPYHQAWSRRFFKECVLSLSVGSLAALLWSKDERQ